MRRTIISLCLSLICLVPALAAADQVPPPSRPLVDTTTWSGIIPEDAVAKLAGSGTLRTIPPGSPFLYGVVTDEATWRAVIAREPRLAGASIDFRRHAVLFVVLRANTNALSLRHIIGGKGHGATVDVRWDGIEPPYSKANPVMLLRLDREMVRNLHVTVNNAPLGDITIK